MVQVQDSLFAFATYLFDANKYQFNFMDVFSEGRYNRLIPDNKRTIFILEQVKFEDLDVMVFDKKKGTYVPRPAHL